MSLVEIHYTRPAGSVTVFRQHLVHRDTGCIVTLLDHAAVAQPLRVRGHVVLDRGAPIVWFTFPGAWHDIGRFHTMDGTFTGYYANVLTPVHFVTPLEWETTDLWLDVWLDEAGAVLLDEDELQAALLRGSISVEHARRARAEAATLLAAAGTGRWPPQICREWTLARARVALGGAGGTSGGAAV